MHKKSRIPVLLWLAWGTYCLTLIPVPPSVWLRYPALLFPSPAWMAGLLFLLPLAIRPLCAVLRHMTKDSFYIRVTGEEARVHLSSLAQTRTPAQLKRHWRRLLQLTAQALRRGQTVTMASHLLTPARITRLAGDLRREGLDIRLQVAPRETPVSERCMLSLIYLLAQWRFPPLHHTGATLYITATLAPTIKHT